MIDKILVLVFIYLIIIFIMRQITYQYECYKNKTNIQSGSIKSSNSQNTHQISLTPQSLSLNQKQLYHSLFGSRVEPEIEQISRIDKDKPKSIQQTAQWPQLTSQDILDKRQLQHIKSLSLSSIQDTLTNLTDLTKNRKSSIKEKDHNEVSFQNESKGLSHQDQSKHMFRDNQINDQQTNILSQSSLFIRKDPNQSNNKKDIQQSQYNRLSSLKPIKGHSFEDALINQTEPGTQLLKDSPKKVQHIDSESRSSDNSSDNSSYIEQYKNQTLQQIELLYDELLPEQKYENSQISLLLPISDTQQENELNSDWVQINANEIVNDHNKKTISYNYQTDEDQSELTELVSTVTENTSDGDLLIFNSQFIDQLPNTVNVHYKTD